MERRAAPHTPLEVDRIRRHLRELLASDAFAASTKLSRFLEFTVEQTLAGNGEALKEYRIGVEIYGRPPDYDPRTDPIIRVEARRLRAKLKEYYETRGASAPVQVEYPKGSYAPEFRRRERAPAEPIPATRFSPRRVIARGGALGFAVLAALAVGLRPHTPTPAPEPVLTKVTADGGLSAWPSLSLGGERVAYASDRDSPGELHIWTQQIEGGQPVRLTHEPATNTEPSFSADGRVVAYRSDRGAGGGIYVVPSGGGAERLLIANGRRPRYSPDGKWLTYWIQGKESASGRDELYVLPLRGGPARRILPEFTSATLPNWSSDGKHLLFRGTSGSPRTLNWWVVDAEAGGPPIGSDAIGVLLKHHMIQALPWDFRPYAWVDDRVLFSVRLGEVTNIWQLHLSPASFKATGAAERLTSGMMFDEYPAMVKPAGRKPVLAFAETAASINVWSMRLDANRGKAAGEPEPVTNEMLTWMSWPSVSADGTKMVHIFLRSKEKAYVYVRDVRKGVLARISPNPMTHSFPAMSADGSRVAFRVEQDHEEPIYVVPADTAESEIHGTSLCADCGRPMSWSPDNRKLLFGTNREPPSIAVLDTASGQKTELFSDPTFDLEAARFSPSGDWIAFAARDRAGTGRIFVSRFDGIHNQGSRPWIEIPDSAGKDLLATWSPDGNLLYILSERDGFRCIWAQRLEHASKRPIAAPFAVRHFHQLRHSLLSTISSPPEAVGLAVARDRMFFTLDDQIGNVWIAKWQ